jgi:hypothetical protein
MVHYWYCHLMVPVLVMAFMHLGPLTVSARYITSTVIKWCQYWYWYICTFVQYQYWHGTLLVLPLLGARTGIGMLVLLFRISSLQLLALNGASTGIGIFALWSNTSIGRVHYWYWHKTVPDQYWHLCILVQD